MALLSKGEFIQQYILARASAIANDMEGVEVAKCSLDVWNTIKEHVHSPIYDSESNSPSTDPIKKEG